jgi:aryl-alcohol dehydrogenase-like predicted oxidoreductase
MRRLQQEGKIRVIAGSNFGVKDLPEIMQHGRIEVNELPYNLLWRAIEPEILPLCEKLHVSVTAYMPLMQGLLTGKFRTAADVPDPRARTRHFSSGRSLTRHGEAGAEEDTFAAIAGIRQICSDAGLPMDKVALAWVLHQPIIASVIVGVRNPQQARANAAADLKLSESMVSALNAATEPLKRKLGPNPDMWQSGEKARFR